MHWSKFWGMIYVYLYLYKILAPIVRRRHYCAQVDILQNLKVETISTGRFHVFRTWKEDQSLLSTKHLCLWMEETHFQVVTNIGKNAVLLLSVINDMCTWRWWIIREWIKLTQKYSWYSYKHISCPCTFQESFHNPETYQVLLILYHS